MLLIKIILLGLYIQLAHADSSSCLNGGVSGTDGCECLPYWKGSTCGQILCTNGGYTDSLNRYCICPSGYFGLHCEAATQTKPATKTFQLKDPSLNLIYYNLFSDYYGKNAYSIFQKAVNNHVAANSQYYKNVNIYRIADLTSYPQNCNHDDNTCDYGPDGEFMEFQTPSVGNINFQEVVFPKSYWCYYVPMYEYILKMIQKGGLEDTTINILTQHPPLPDDDGLNALVQAAIGFRIRINILFSDDQTFIRCTPDQINSLRQLSSRTGGIFTDVPSGSMYNETNTIINTILTTNIYYDVIDVAVGVNDITFSADPLINNYYVVLSNGVVSDDSGCLGITNGPDSNEHAVYQLFNAAIHPCSLKFKQNSDAKIVVKIFVAGNEKTFRSFYSFVEDALMDTSKTMPYDEIQYNLALRFNYDSPLIKSLSIAQASFIDQQANTGIPIVSGSDDLVTRQDYSLDNFIKRGFTCLSSSADDIFGIRLTLRPQFTASQPPLLMKRYIPIHCLTLPPPVTTTVTQNTVSTTVMTTKLTTVSTTVTKIPTSASTTVPSSTPAPTTVTSAPLPKPKKTYILGYTSSVDESAYETFLLASTAKTTGNLYQHYTDFGEVLFQDKKFKIDTGYVSQTDYPSFIQAVYNDQKKNLDNVYYDQPQILEALQSIMQSSNAPDQNSLVSFLTDTLPLQKAPFADADIAVYKDFINKNNKVLFWIDNSDFDSQINNFKRSPDMLNLLAAITNGHLIVTNHSSPDFSNLLSDFYSKGPAQNLVFSKTFSSGPLQSIGSVDYQSITSNITIFASATVFIQKSADIQFRPLNLKFTSQTTGNAIPVTMNYMPNSNLYTADFVLTPDKYTVSALFFDSNSRIVSLRLWNSELMFTDLQMTYKDYDENTISSPDTNFGAALRAQMVGAQTNSLKVTYSDCRSKVLQTSYFDAQQSVDISTDSFNFVPLFCQKRVSTEMCPPGTERIYNMQISTTDGTFIGTKSFYCDDSTTPFDCSTVDSNGNYFCDTPIAPFLRGPAKKLLDCSDNGKLVWSEDAPSVGLGHYKCICNDPALTGLSCEHGTCDDTPQPGSLDIQFRTYTAIIAFLPDNTLTKAVFLDALPVLSVDEATTNIWLYQILVYCTNGDYFPVYIGKDPKEFNAALKSPDNKITCAGSASDSGVLDISDAFRVSTSSIGKDQNGVVVLYYESVTPLESISIDNEKFYENAQQYRQKFFVYNAIENSDDGLKVDTRQDIITATLATGGTTIIDDLLLNDVDPTIPLFQRLIKAKTSLNYHNFNKDAITGIQANIESEAYVIIGGSASQGTIASDADNYSIFTKISKITSTQFVNLNTNNPASWASVVVLDGVAIPHAILKDRAVSDTWSAVSVSQTDARTVLGIKTPDGYTLTNSLYPHSRRASRTSCSFDTVLYQPITSMPLGYSQHELTLLSADGKNKINKVFPIITSSSSDCKNNVSDQSKGACTCPNTFTGPDCSRLVCGDHGLLSTWGGACNCDGTIGGRFCNSQVNSFLSFFR
ncbi:unnamed protein product [Auanema sp. JU1783]|nr:unnamed protein product [Auanema sp. JU1783]